MITGAIRTSHRRPPTPQHADMDTDDETVLPKRNRMAAHSQTSDVAEQYENILDAITTLPTRIQVTNTNHIFLHTQLPTFIGNKDRFVEFEHLLRNHFQPFSNRLTEEVKLQYFWSLPHEEAKKVFQSLTVSTETTLTDLLSKLRKQIHQGRSKGDRKIQIGIKRSII